MTLYHGSNTANIKILKPNQADHDRPYVYMTTIDVVAAFYLCNAVERPYYWFPYGFENGSSVPIYQELYPNALKEVSDGVSGYIYKVNASEEQVIPFKNIPCARLATEPVEVAECIRVKNAYDLFLDYVNQGKMRIGRFEDKTEESKMPPKAKITKYMVVDAFEVVREEGAENINARTVAKKLNCSTQPVMYHFATIEELKRAVYEKTDKYHTEYLMNISEQQKGVMLGIGLNYVQFAIKEAMGMSMAQTKEVFLIIAMFAHGYASIIANNSLEYDEELVASHLERAYRGAVLAVQEKTNP